MISIALALSLAFQTPVAPSDPNESTFLTALANLADNQSLFLQLVGSISLRTRSTPIVTSLSWSSSTTTSGKTQQPLLQVEIQEAVNGVLVTRIVGDGNTLWKYDLIAHTYSATNYGGTGTTRPSTYQSDLLAYLNWAATGPSAYVTKFLRQIYTPSITSISNSAGSVSSSSTYSSWMPGVFSLGLQQNLPVYDPINNFQTYTATANDWFYMYNGSPKRSIVFEILPVSESNGAQPILNFQSVYFNQLDQAGKNNRLTSWKLTPYTGVTFSPDIFKPYNGAQVQGWRPIVGAKPVNN